MQTEVLREYRGPITEEEQCLIVSIQEFIREAIKQRISLIRTLTTIALRLERQSTRNDLLVVSKSVEIEDPQTKKAEHPLNAIEETFLEAVDAFIRNCADDGLRFELIQNALLRDIYGIIVPHPNGPEATLPGYPRKGFTSTVIERSKLDWDEWANDPVLKEENERINAEFLSSEADGLGPE